MKYILYYKQQISRWNVTNCTYILPWISPRHLRCFCWFSSSSPWLLSVLAWPAQWRSPRPGACTPTWRTRSSCRWWVACSGRSPSLWCSGRSGRTGRRMSATGGSFESLSLLWGVLLILSWEKRGTHREIRDEMRRNNETRPNTY